MASTALPPVEKGRWYPELPPALPGESVEHYTNRLAGSFGTDQTPYDHLRGWQCALGHHSLCTGTAAAGCQCPCHQEDDGSEYRGWLRHVDWAMATWPWPMAVTVTALVAANWLLPDQLTLTLIHPIAAAATVLFVAGQVLNAASRIHRWVAARRTNRSTR